MQTGQGRLAIFKRTFNIAGMPRGKTSPRPRKRRMRDRGRPPVEADADVRNTLLSAATKLFLKRRFDKVTARQIAATAGTTPAMIHYYFGSKLGLFRAMLQQAIQPFQRQLTAALAEEAAAPDLPSLIAAHMRTVAANPWVPALIVNEVLAEGGKFRATFVREMASPMLALLIQVIQRSRSSGRLRSELDPRLAALSLLSLCVFPFLARPVVTNALGLELEGEELERLIAHNARLCLEGFGERPQ